MNILFTADDKYAVRIPVVLKSIQINNPGTDVHIFLISDEKSISENTEKLLDRYCAQLHFTFSFYEVSDGLFSDAPVNKYYSKAMYYRLLAGEILPESVERVIYLDPDILVINSLLPLWECDLEGCCFAAASHTSDQETLDNLNKIRLNTESPYFNTGVLLLDLDKCRKTVNVKDILEYINDNERSLLLPDQDVFNALYGNMTKLIPDEIWNYDARRFSYYLVKSSGKTDYDWMIDNTVILHYCGKEKPWHKRYRYRTGLLYKHYQRIYLKDAAAYSDLRR